eukprot:scaffold149769_cov35-Prasinocladus_malaysianus.AAC.1
MAGGAYVLSRDLVQKVRPGTRIMLKLKTFLYKLAAVEQMSYITLADRLPEDASVGRLLGSDVFDSCRCSDTRHVKHVTNVQGMNLFSTAMDDCERIDISRRTLTMHGFKNLTQMGDVLEYVTHDYELECSGTKRDFGSEPMWGRQVSVVAWAQDVFYANMKLAMSLVWVATPLRLNCLAVRSFKTKVDPHQLLERKKFVSFRQAWAPKVSSDIDKERRDRAMSEYQKSLIPLVDVLSSMEKREIQIPWCTRILWATEVQTPRVYCHIQQKISRDEAEVQCSIGHDLQ